VKRTFRALSTIRGALLVLGALVVYAGECVLLAVAVAQFVLAWFIEPTGFDAVPSAWPLSLFPSGPPRFWFFIACCIVVAALLRCAAGRLFARVMTRTA
jgi:hypothetical protein